MMDFKFGTGLVVGLALTTLWIGTGCDGESVASAEADRILTQVETRDAGLSDEIAALAAVVDALSEELADRTERLVVVEGELADARGMGFASLAARLDAMELGGGDAASTLTRLEAELGGAPDGGPSDGYAGSRLDTAGDEVAALDARVGTLEGAVSAHTLEIATNASETTANALGVADNASDIATTAVDIAVNGAGIVANSGQLALHATGIAANASDIASNASDIASNTVDIASTASDTASNTVDIASNTVDVASNTSDIAGLDTRVSALEGLGLSASSVSAWNDAVSWGDHSLAGYVELIDTNLTLDVPTSFTDVNAALAYLDGFAIAHDTTVSIVVSADATYTEPIEVAHPSGDRIEIVGGGPSVPTLTFVGSAGLLVQDGNALGLLDGLTLVGDQSASPGVGASWGAMIRLGPDVDVEDFSAIGVLAASNGTIQADGVASMDHGLRGFQADRGAYIQANNAAASGNPNQGYYASNASLIDATDATATMNGDGFRAEDGATLLCNDCVATSNNINGFHAVRGSGIRADGALAVTNGNTGFGADDGSWLRVVGTTAQTNTNNGLSVNGGSMALATQFISDGNMNRGASSSWGTYVNIGLAQLTNNAAEGLLTINGGITLANDFTSSDNGGYGHVFEEGGLMRDLGTGTFSGNALGPVDGPVANPDPAYSW